MCVCVGWTINRMLCWCHGEARSKACGSGPGSGQSTIKSISDQFLVYSIIFSIKAFLPKPSYWRLLQLASH
jgi:hypothetical protein